MVGSQKKIFNIFIAIIGALLLSFLLVASLFFPGLVKGVKGLVGVPIAFADVASPSPTPTPGPTPTPCGNCAGCGGCF